MTTVLSSQSGQTDKQPGSFWSRLFEPPAHIQDVGRRRDLRLLLTMSGVGTLLILVFGVLVLPWATQPDNPLQSPVLYQSLVSVVFSIASYGLARRGLYEPAAVSLIIVSILGPLTTANVNYGFAVLVIVAPLFAFLFLPGLAVAAAAGAGIIGLFILKALSPEMSWDVLLPLVTAAITLPALFYVARQHLDNVAREQKAIVEERTTILTRQAGEIDKVFRLASIGNFEARAEVFSDDELGRAAGGVNAMLSQLSSLIESTQAELSGFLDSFGGFVGMADMEGNALYINLAGRQMIGLDLNQDLTGKAISDFQPDEDARILFEKALPVALKEGAWTRESRLVHVEGHHIPVDQTFFVIRDEQGEPRALGTIMTDISARKQAEANLTRALTVAKMAYVEIDVPNQMLLFDDNFYKIYGVLPGQEGRNEMPLETYIQRHLHPDTRQDFLDAFQKAVEATDPEYTAEVVYRIVRADGEEGVAAGLARIQKDAEGNTIKIIAANQDITEAKLAEAQLAVQNQALNNAFEELRKLITNVDFAARQLSDASESIMGVISLLSGQATTSAQLAEQATATAQEGDQAVNDTISAMGRIRESTQETTRRIKRLGEASQEIGEVVRLIDEIADRVTVLALNASIQAAAAGEAGRGFAVVAEEVQRLAERATNATRQIENMVKGIQGEINEAMIGVEEATQEVVGGSQLAQNAGERISDLSRAIEDLSGMVQHVAETTSVQTTESLAVLAALAADLQASVSALDIPADAGQLSDNGGGKVTTSMLAGG
ncbi:MAG: PAS domain-containing protein [Anaerolineae bacterium]|nr:PAS domain-containing protein [Anaerolineae bacterium]